MYARQPLPRPSPKVLIVEDDAAVGRVLRMSLCAAGFDVVALPSGTEALNVLKQPGAIDAVIVDLGLPDGRGRAILDRMRRLKRRDLPVCVVISALDREEVARRYGRLSRCFLAKPFDPWDLVLVVEKLLFRRSSERHGQRWGRGWNGARPGGDLPGRERFNRAADGWRGAVKGGGR